MKKSIVLLLLVTNLCMKLTAQPLSAVALTKQFNEYHQQSFTEKLYVHTDRQFYLAGETIWFKIYYLDGMYHKPASLSRIAYLEVLDKDNKPAVQTMITLNNGSGNGWVQLPFTVGSGVFRLRAYTSWMKNFDADYYFEKPVTIVNSLKPLEPLPSAAAEYEVRFFPEGGNLVQNLESKVAFRVTDRNGKGLLCKGVVVKNNRDTLGSFETFRFGMGHFNLLPEAGSYYKAVFMTIDTSFTKPLPQALPSGYVMNVSQLNSDRLAINITTSVSDADSVILFVHTRHVIKYAVTMRFHQAVASFELNRNMLGKGISHFTVLDRSGRPVCERLYFVRPAQGLSVNASMEKQIFTSREKVTVSLFTADHSGYDGYVDLSVSVFPADTFQSHASPNILSYTWLQSDLRGNIESAQSYFTDTSVEGEKASDLLMLTHGWRRFTWQQVLTDRKQQISFLPELSGHIIHAKVTHAQTSVPAKHVTTYLSVPGNHVQLYGGKADDDGLARYYVKDLYGKNELIFQPAGDTNISVNIATQTPFSPKFSASIWPPFMLPAGTEPLLLDYSTTVQVQHAFSYGSRPEIQIPVTDSTAFYGTPDDQYLLENYVRFSSMEDVLREYVPGVLVRRRREDFHLIMADGVNHRFLDDPLTLLNGVPIPTNKLMQYNPLKAWKLEVVKRKYFYGPLVFNGIINLTSYRPDPEVLSGLAATIVDYEGIQYKREFYSPVYETAGQVANRLPDFRKTLYWSPDVMRGKSGKAEITFYTPDNKGDYVIFIEGMNKQGNMATTLLRLQVK